MATIGRKFYQIPIRISSGNQPPNLPLPVSPGGSSCQANHHYSLSLRRFLIPDMALQKRQAQHLNLTDYSSQKAPRIAGKHDGERRRLDDEF